MGSNQAVNTSGAMVSLARLLLNIRAVQRLAREARPLPAGRIGRFAHFAEARTGSRPAPVCVSNDIRGACAVGFFQPRVMLSADLVATLDDDAIEAIVLHEYAHLQRYDDWTRLVQQFVLSLAGAGHAVTRHPVKVNQVLHDFAASSLVYEVSVWIHDPWGHRKHRSALRTR